MRMVQGMWSGSVVAVMVLAGAAVGQVALPPTPAPAPTPDYVPPPAAPAPAQRPIPTVAKPVDVPFEAWRKDGKLPSLSEPLYWAAMRRNTLVTPESWAKITPFLDRRVPQLERVVVDNVDLVRKIEEGQIEKAMDAQRNAEGRNPEMGTLLRTLRPLVMDSLRNELMKRNLITRQQAEQTEKIRRSYVEERSRDWEAKVPALAADATDEQKKEHQRLTTRERMRSQMYDFIDEPMWVYQRLLVECAVKWDQVSAVESFPAATKQKLAPLMAKAKAASDDASRLSAMREVVRGISAEEERDLLVALRSLRPDPATDEGEEAPANAEQPAEGAVTDQK